MRSTPTRLLFRKKITAIYADGSSKMNLGIATVVRMLKGATNVPVEVATDAAARKLLAEQHFVGDLLKAEISEKQARSIKYQLTIAKLPLAKDIDDFTYKGTPIRVGLEFRNRLSVYSSRSLVGLHTLEGFPDFPFGDVERLYLAHGLLPLPVGLWPRLNNAAPSLQPHYRTFITTTGCSAPVLRIGTLALAVGSACGLSLHAIGVTEPRFSRSIRKPGRASRRLHAGCRSGRIRHPPSSSRRKGHPPVLTSPNPLSTLHRRFACARLSRPCLRDHRPSVSATLTTPALDRGSLRWLEIST